MSGEIKVGVSGLGALAQRGLLPALVRSPHFHLSAICSPSRNQLRELGRLYGIDAQFTDWRKMLETQDLQALVVLGDYRQEILTAAIERGIHVFTAAPLAYNVEDAVAIRDLSDEKQVVVLVAHLRRYDASYERAQRIVQDILNEDDARIISLTDIRTSPEEDIADLIPMTELAPGASEESLTKMEKAMEAVIGADANTSLRTAYRTLMDASDQVSVLRGLLGRPREVLHAGMLPLGNFLIISLGYPGELQALLTIGRTHRFRPEERLEIHGVQSSLVYEPPDFSHDLEDGLIVRTAHDPREEVRRSYRVGPSKAVENALAQFAECIQEGAAAPTGTHPGVEEIITVQSIMEALKASQGGGNK